MLSSGQEAPEFRLPDTGAKPVTLGGFTSRGPVLIAFFKISCPVCQLTMPYLERIASSTPLPVLGISQDDVKSTVEFCRQNGVRFPVVLDNPAVGYPVSNAYGITNVPSLFLIEPDGTIAVAFSGFSRADLEQIGTRFGASPFREGENVPEYKPG